MERRSRRSSRSNGQQRGTESRRCPVRLSARARLKNGRRMLFWAARACGERLDFGAAGQGRLSPARTDSPSRAHLAVTYSGGDHGRDDPVRAHGEGSAPPRSRFRVALYISHNITGRCPFVGCENGCGRLRVEVLVAAKIGAVTGREALVNVEDRGGDGGPGEAPGGDPGVVGHSASERLVRQHAA